MNETNELFLLNLQPPRHNDLTMNREKVVASLQESVKGLANGRLCLVNLYGIIGTGRTYLLREAVASKCVASDIEVLWFELDKQFNNYMALELANHVLKRLSAQVYDNTIEAEVNEFIGTHDRYDAEIAEEIGVKVAALLKHILKKLKESSSQIAIFIDDLDFLTRTEHKWFQQYILEGLTENSGIGVFISTQTPISPWRWQFGHRIRFIELQSFSLKETVDLCNSNREIARLIHHYSGGHPATVMRLFDLTKVCFSTDDESKQSFQFTEEIKKIFFEILRKSIDDNLIRVDKHLRKYFYYASAAITFDPNLLRDISTHFNFSDNIIDFTDLAWDMSATGLVEWDSIEGHFSGYYLAENLRYRLVFLSQNHEDERLKYIETLKLLIEKYEERAKREFEWSEALALYLYYTGLLSRFDLSDDKDHDDFRILRESMKNWLQREDVESEKKNALAVQQVLKLLPIFLTDFQESADIFLRHLDRIGAEQLEVSSA